MKPLTKYRNLVKPEINELFNRACQDGEFDKVRLFLTELDWNRADVGYKDNNGIKVCCYFGHLDVAQYLIESKELDENIKFNSALFLNCIDNSILGFKSPKKMDVFKYLLSLEEFQDFKHNYRDYFRLAVLNDNIDVLKYLIVEGKVCETKIVKALLIECGKLKFAETVAKVEELFNLVELNKSLNKDLDSHYTQKKKPKHSKI